MTNQLDERDKHDFHGWIYGLIKENHSGGLFWKARLRWKLTQRWNDRFSNIGIPGRVKDILGEDEATKLFQTISSDVMNNPDLLWSVLNDDTDDDKNGLSREQDSNDTHTPSKLDKTVEHAIKNIKSIIDDKDKSNKIMETFATTLIMASKFAEHETDEDSKWFVDEVSYVTSKDASTASIFNFYALGFIHAQSTEAYKASEQGASDELPEVSAVVLGSTRAIYEAVMKKVVSDNKTRGHEDKR